MSGKSTTIRISDETHSYLVNASNRLGIALKRKMTMDETVKYSSLSLYYLVAVAKIAIYIIQKDSVKNKGIIKKFVEQFEDNLKTTYLEIPEKERGELTKLFTHIIAEALPAEFLANK